jgi:hypothetical protein
VRALLGVLICHYYSFPSRSIDASAPQVLTYALIAGPTCASSRTQSGRQLLSPTLSNNCIRISKPRRWRALVFQCLPLGSEAERNLGVDGPIVRRYLDGSECVSFLIDLRLG